MRLKSALAATLLSASFAAPAFANQAQPANLPQFSAADMQVMFEQDAKPMQLATLSQQEMKETEGAWLWMAPILGGAVSNGIGYSYNNPNWNWAGFSTAVGTGAFGGAMGGFGGWGVTLFGGLYSTNVTGWW